MGVISAPQSVYHSAANESGRANQSFAQREQPHLVHSASGSHSLTR